VNDLKPSMWASRADFQHRHLHNTAMPRYKITFQPPQLYHTELTNYNHHNLALQINSPRACWHRHTPFPLSQKVDLRQQETPRHHRHIPGHHSVAHMVAVFDYSFDESTPKSRQYTKAPQSPSRFPVQFYRFVRDRRYPSLLLWGLCPLLLL